MNRVKIQLANDCASQGHKKPGITFYRIDVIRLQFYRTKGLYH